MALTRKITLRNVKGSALTYEEMDKNLSSFFYSASLSGTNLLLHYTGSAVLNAPYTPTSVIVPLNPLLQTVQQLTVAGSNVGDVQYRINPSTLGANTGFKWDTVNARLGVGTPSPATTLHVDQGNPRTPSTIRVSTLGTGIKPAAIASVEFAIGNTIIGNVGKLSKNTNDLYVRVENSSGNNDNSVYTTIGSINLTQATKNGLSISTAGAQPPNQTLTVQGTIGIGSDTGANQGIIGSMTNKVSTAGIPQGSGTTGLLIESPKTAGALTGGHVVIGLNASLNSNRYAFSVVGNKNGATYGTALLTVQATGKVGINNANPTEALDVNGRVRIQGHTEITDELQIGTVTAGTSNTKVLTLNSNGTVQYTTNIMPLGGIIMWGGSPTSLPNGWTLCDGRAAVNGVTIPDLRERFIVGAGGDNPAVADSSGYNTNATGGLNQVTLTIPQMPSHTHAYRMSGDDSDSTSGPLFTADNNEDVGVGSGLGFTGGNQAHENRPPYYALAFIIYTGI